MLLVGALHTSADAQLVWRVSVKFILNANGNRPATGNLNTDAEVQAQIDLGNEILRAHGRGYQMQLTEIVDLSGVSQWYNADVCDDKTALDNAAKAAPATYAYRNNAVNVYVLGNNGSGCASFPDSGDDIIVVAQGLRTTTFLHEMGHIMNLCHTQGCPCGSCAAGETGQCNTTPGNDNISDTLPDLECWTRNDISQWTYGQNYSNLSAAQQGRVDDVFNNIMSYHSTRNILTPDQLDRATDTSNGTRNWAASGRTRFVDDDYNGFFEFGTSALPFNTVAEGLNSASSGDIVLMRSGTYTAPTIINQRVFLLASRGNAILGVSSGDVMLAEPEVRPRPNVPDTFDGRTGE